MMAYHKAGTDINCKDEYSGNTGLSMKIFCALFMNPPLEINITLPIHPSLKQALHYAAANGELLIVLYLLKNGALHLQNSNGNYPLHWAVQNKRIEISRALLQMKWKCKEDGNFRGVDVLARNSFGRSALTDAFEAQTPALLEMVLEHPSASEDKLVPENSKLAEEESAPKDAEKSEVVQAKVHQIILDRQKEQSAAALLCREVGLSWMGDAFVDTDAATDTTGVVHSP